MYDLTIEPDDRLAGPAAVGETLGAAGIDIEGGGLCVVDDRLVAHFLVHDGEAARSALRAAGIAVTACRRILARRLDQDRPGELGAVARALADAGVGIEVLYSDHDHRLILVVDDPATGAVATAAWDRPDRRTPAADRP